MTIPAPLATQIRRIAKERNLTISRALVVLAERGVRAAYQRFMKELEPARKDEAGRDLIRAIFGKDSIAEDSLL